MLWGLNQPLPQYTKPKESPTALGLCDWLTWLLNNNVGNSLNVANDVNVNVNDVNGASNVNAVADEKKLLINHFLNIKYWANVKLIRNKFSLSLKNWGKRCLFMFLIIFMLFMFFSCCLRSEQILLLILGKI